MKPWPLPVIPSKTQSDGHLPTVVQRTASLKTVLARPFRTAYNTLGHLIAEFPELQYVAILTMDSVHKMHALSSTFARHVRASIPASLVQTGDQPTSECAMTIAHC